jgi:hypothetical protein
MLSEWIGDAATSELAFSRSMMLLCSYSLLEAVEGLAGYTTHPAVHQWTHYSQDKRLATKLPHMQAGSRWVDQAQRRGYSGGDGVEGDADEGETRQAVLGRAHLLGSLYADQGKLAEAEEMYLRALRGKNTALGPEHTSTLQTVSNLGKNLQ